MPTLLAVLIPVLVGFTIAASAPATKPTGKQFSDSKGEFTVTAPATWKEGQLGLGREGLRVMGPPPAGTKAYPIFQVQRVIQDPPDRPIDEDARMLVEQFTGKPADQTKIEKATLDGVEARKFSLTLNSDDTPIGFSYVIAIRNQQLFILNFMQEKAHYDADVATALFDSFRWSK
jgi:hypothetical protein